MERYIRLRQVNMGQFGSKRKLAVEEREKSGAMRGAVADKVYSEAKSVAVAYQGDG